MVGGKLAVQGFFVISGFYMSLILNEKYPAGAGGSWLFYSNRFLRIYPIYWAILTVSVALFATIFFAEYFVPTLFHSYFHNLTAVGPAQRFWELSVDKILFLVGTNVGLFGMDVGYFLRFDLAHLAFTKNWSLNQPHPSDLYFIPQAWSLAIEVSVYVIAPFIFRRSVGFLFALFFFSFALRTYVFDAGYKYDPWDYRFFPFEFGLFLAGALLYRLYRTAPQVVHHRAVGWLSLSVCIASIIAYQFVPATAQSDGSLFGFERREWLFLAPFAMCLPATFALSKSWKFDRWVGELSYPIYLCHLIVVQACNGKFGWQGVKPIIGSVIVAIALTISLEVPLNRIRQARTRRFMLMTAEPM